MIMKGVRTVFREDGRTMLSLYLGTLSEEVLNEGQSLIQARCLFSWLSVRAELDDFFLFWKASLARVGNLFHNLHSRISKTEIVMMK